MLAVDLAQVSDEEGIFLANVAGIRINSLDTALESVGNQLLGFPGAMIVNTTSGIGAERLYVFQRELVFFGSRESRRCHALDGGFQEMDNYVDYLLDRGAVLRWLEGGEAEAWCWARSGRFLCERKNR